MGVHPEQRFLDKIAVGNGCWVWIAGKFPSGYGNFWYQGRAMPAHVFSYQYYVGSIPDGLELDHLCRNRSCVYYRHLEPVTHRENVLRGELPRERCPQDHPKDSINSRGYRICRICARAAQRRWKLRQKRMV